MKKFKSILSLFLLSFPIHSFADIVEEGQVTRKISISNLSQFKDYRFFILFQNYTYDQGPQPGVVDTIWIEQGREYITGAKGDQSKLYGILNSDPSAFFSTGEEIGGYDIIGNSRISFLIDQYGITTIKDGIIVIQKEKTISVYENGTRKSSREGGWFFGGIQDGPLKIFGINGMFVLIPIVATLLLIILYLIRKKLTSSANRDVRPAA